MGELGLKSILQLDLYVEGMNRIRKNFLNDKNDLGIRFREGVLVVDKKLYFDTEKQIKERFQDINYSSKYIGKIYGGLEKLKENNNVFEEALFFKRDLKINISNYLNQLLDVMSYMIVQWLSFDVVIMSQISKKTISEMSFLCAPVFYEPYHIRQKKAYYHLLKNQNEKEFEKYILKYAFLNNFEIDMNDDENLTKLEKKVSLDRCNIEKYEKELERYDYAKKNSLIQRQKIIEEVLTLCRDDEYLCFYNNLALMRMSADEEEERHYQQARAVRNFRVFFEKNNMDIYSGIKEIRGE